MERTFGNDNWDFSCGKKNFLESYSEIQTRLKSQLKWANDRPVTRYYLHFTNC